MPHKSVSKKLHNSHEPKHTENESSQRVRRIDPFVCCECGNEYYFATDIEVKNGKTYCKRCYNIFTAGRTTYLHADISETSKHASHIHSVDSPRVQKSSKSDKVFIMVFILSLFFISFAVIIFHVFYPLIPQPIVGQDTEFRPIANLQIPRDGAQIQDLFPQIEELPLNFSNIAKYGENSSWQAFYTSNAYSSLMINITKYGNNSEAKIALLQMKSVPQQTNSSNNSYPVIYPNNMLGEEALIMYYELPAPNPSKAITFENRLRNYVVIDTINAGYAVHIEYLKPSYGKSDFNKMQEDTIKVSNMVIGKLR